MRDMAQFFKVLADEARLKMLWLLLHHEELCVCDLMAALGITQSKASRHLATLRHAGLVRDRRVGAWSYYALCPSENALIQAHLDALAAGLGEHPGIHEVEARLKVWLVRKERGDACPADETERADLDGAGALADPCRPTPCGPPMENRG